MLRQMPKYPFSTLSILQWITVIIKGCIDLFNKLIKQVFVESPSKASHISLANGYFQQLIIIIWH